MLTLFLCMNSFGYFLKRTKAGKFRPLLRTFYSSESFILFFRGMDIIIQESWKIKPVF